MRNLFTFLFLLTAASAFGGTNFFDTVQTAGQFNGSGAGLTALSASQLSSGTVPDSRFPATLPVIGGGNLTNLNWVLDTNSINTGVIPCGKLTLTNLTGNITLGGFSGTDPNRESTALLFATNSTAGNLTITMPPGMIEGSTGKPFLSAVVTNQSAKFFSFAIICKNFTNGVSNPPSPQ